MAPYHTIPNTPTRQKSLWTFSSSTEATLSTKKFTIHCNKSKAKKNTVLLNMITLMVSIGNISPSSFEMLSNATDGSCQLVDDGTLHSPLGIAELKSSS